jgi:hypothetical protein
LRRLRCSGRLSGRLSVWLFPAGDRGGVAFSPLVVGWAPRIGHQRGQVGGVRDAGELARANPGRMLLPGLGGDELTDARLDGGRTKLVHPYQRNATEDEYAAEDLQPTG